MAAIVSPFLFARIAAIPLTRSRDCPENCAIFPL